ncbi:hypothetical protein ACFQU7_20685 [Pseudoroseomonas wenyumeiae]
MRDHQGPATPVATDDDLMRVTEGDSTPDAETDGVATPRPATPPPMTGTSATERGLRSVPGAMGQAAAGATPVGRAPRRHPG